MLDLLHKSFSATEAAALADVSAKRVHKEIEEHILDVPRPPRLPFSAVVYLRAVRLIDFELPVAVRTRLARQLAEAMERPAPADTIEIARLVVLRWCEVREELQQRLERFLAWQGQLVKRADIMGGQLVFPGSRLSVRRVGEMLERGERPEVVLEDYPNLTAEDLDFARLYVRAYPRVGRPSSKEH